MGRDSYDKGYKSGHTRGSTVDLTLFDMRTEKEVDMGGNVLWKGDTYKADATMFNGYRATNTCIKKVIEKGFQGNLFKKAGR